MRPSRRDFVKGATVAGIALSLSRLGWAQEPGFATRETLPGRQNWNPAATGAGRIDGVAKATGAKLYASDFRAADLPGWPPNTSHAILVRAPDAHTFTRPRLPHWRRAQISVVVPPPISTKSVPASGILPAICSARSGRTPIYLGQPVALLIFETFDIYDQARLSCATPAS